MTTTNFFLSAGFGGVCALLAAVIAFLAASLSTRQRRIADTATIAETALRREEERRAEAIQQCWDRYVWVIDHTDQIGVRLTIGLLNRIADTADQLGDLELVEFSRQFALELFAAVRDEQPPAERGVVDTGDEEGGPDDSTATT